MTRASSSLRQRGPPRLAILAGRAALELSHDRELQRLGFRICACYLLDSQFVADAAKFISGVLCCLSAMTSLELAHVNVLSKCDLLPSRKHLDEFLEADGVQEADGRVGGGGRVLHGLAFRRDRPRRRLGFRR